MSTSDTAVIIPLYNGGQWIEETLSSIRAQKVTPAEIVVVDDGSTDDSVEKVRRFSDVKLLRNPEKGANAAREFGLAQSRGKFVCMLDQDDLWHPEHLERLDKLAAAHPESNAVFAAVIRFNGDERPSLKVDASPAIAFDPWLSFPAAVIPTPSQVLIRREALTALGGWTRKFVGLADYHAWLRLSAEGPFWHAPQLTVGYRQHPSSHSASLRRDQQNAYIMRLFAAAEDTLAYRAKAFPQSVPALEQRLKTARRMAEWLSALERNESKETAIAARQLETEIRSQPREVLESLWGQLFYLWSGSQSQASGVTKARRVLRTYWKAPLATRHLRRSLRGLVFKRVRETVSRSVSR